MGAGATNRRLYHLFCCPLYPPKVAIEFVALVINIDEKQAIVVYPIQQRTTVNHITLTLLTLLMGIILTEGQLITLVQAIHRMGEGGTPKEYTWERSEMTVNLGIMVGVRGIATNRIL